MKLDAGQLADRLRDRDLSAAPAVLNLVESRSPQAREQADALLAAISPAVLGGESAAHIVGVTGPPGVGKSSLLSALLSRWRSEDRSVAVLAVDPSSRRSGGALLGDRARIDFDPSDRSVFIRSTAAGDRLGGLAPATRAAASALAVAFDMVVVETVGVGQSETEVADVADTVAVVVQPGSGDVLQFLKAGIMEVPDVLVVTKADLGSIATRAVSDLRSALRSLGETGTALVAVSSIPPTSGIDDLIEALDAHRAALDLPARRLRSRRMHALGDFTAEYGERGLRALDGRRGAVKWLQQQDPGLDVPSLLDALARRAEAGRMSSDVILVVVVVTAVTFDFTNGFHDTANVVATAISTRAITPRVAVTFAALLNFAGAFISLKVATTVGQGFVDTGAVTTTVVFAGLVGAISWNLVTWYYGLPSSSSHALIGGLVGSVIAAQGFAAVNGSGLVSKLIVPAILAPLVAFLVAGIAIVLIYWIVGRLRPGPVSRGFRLGQLMSSGLLSLSHGTNDAQKTMGVITLALVAHGDIPAQHFHVPDWVVLVSATAIALGTFTGGWRIIRTLGSRIIKMDPAQGFAAQGAGAAVILAASGAGYPLSTTHVISGAIMGAGAAKRVSAVRWGVAGNIVTAWTLTLPAAAVVGGLTYALSSVFGSGAVGPLVISAILVTALAALFARRLQQAIPAPITQ